MTGTIVVDALLFDFGGILDADGVPWKDRFRILFQEEGVDPEPAVFDRCFYDADDPITARADPQRPHPANVQELAADLAAHLAARGFETQGLAPRVAQRFLEASQQKIDENLPVLRRLAKHTRIGIVSNFYGNLDVALRETGLDEVVEAAADSGRVGVTKPDCRLFLHTLDALGVEPVDTLMVGDAPHRDVEGARRLGMDYRMLLRADRAEAPADVDPRRVIRRLADLETAFLR